jgi:hypothetical protein
MGDLMRREDAGQGRRSREYLRYPRHLFLVDADPDYASHRVSVHR